MADFENTEAFAENSCGIDFLTDFWQKNDLLEYISHGGSKIKFVSGRPGSRKTHFLWLMTDLARKDGYKTVRFSARDIWMHNRNTRRR